MYGIGVGKSCSKGTAGGVSGMVGNVDSGVISDGTPIRCGLRMESASIGIIFRASLSLCRESGKRNLFVFADIFLDGVVKGSCNPADASSKIFAIFVLWLKLLAERERSGV